MSKSLFILHLEDNKNDVELVKEILILEGLKVRVQSVDNREDFIQALNEYQIDIILADYSLPGFDGLSALKLTQELGLDIPFILVSAVLGEELAIEALQKGAVDYVLKSRMERLVPAIQRALREVEEREDKERLESEIKDLEEMHKRLAERVRGFIKMDMPSGKYSLVDKFIEELSGYSIDDWYNTNNFIKKIIHPDFKDYYQNRFNMMKEGNVPKMLEYKIIRKDGSERWWLQFNIGAYDYNQKLVSVSIVIIDNTEAKESLIKYQNLFETALVGMFRSDVQTGQILDANQTMAEIFGCKTIEELQRFSAADFYSDIHSRNKLMNLIKTQGYVKEYHYQLKQKTGEEIWVSLSAQYYPKEDYIEGIMIDISDEKRAQEELLKRDQELENIFEHKGTATLIVDADMTVIKTNHQLEVLSGYTREDVENERTWVEFVHPDDRERLVAYHKARRQENSEVPLSYECRLLSKQGETIHAFMTVGMIPGTKRSVASIVDITSRKKAEFALARDRSMFKLIAEATVQSSDLHQMCQIILEGLIEEFNFETGQICIYFENEKKLLSMAEYKLDENTCIDLDNILLDKLEVPLSKMIRKEIFAPVVSEHHFLKQTNLNNRLNFQSFISWPIFSVNKNYLGTIQIGSYDKKELYDDDRNFFESFSSIFATAIERKMADEALRESESQYRKLVESLPKNLGLMITCNDKIVFASDAIFEMLQIETFADLHNMDPMDFVIDKDREQLNKYLDELFEDRIETPVFLETSLKRTNKEIFPAELYLTKTLYQGEIAVQVIALNITERRKIEQDRSRLVNIVENSEEVVISADENGIILFANSPVKDVFGYEPEEIIGESISILAPPGSEQVQANLIQSTIDVGKRTMESVRKHKDGSLVPVLVTFVALNDPVTNAITINSILVDISGLKQLQETLNIRSFELEALNKVISVGYIARTMDELLDFTLSTILNSLDFSGGAIFLIEENNEKARLRRSLGMSKSFVTDAEVLNTKSKQFKKLFLEGKSIMVENYMSKSEGHHDYGIHTLIGIPFFSKQKVIGSLFISTKEPRAFYKDDLTTLEAIGREIGTAIAKMEAEEKLISNINYLESIFEAIGEFLLVFSVESKKFRQLNKSYQKKLLYTDKDLMRMEITDILVDISDKQLDNLIEKIKAGKIKKGALKLLGKDNKIHDIEVEYNYSIIDNEALIIAVSK